ncbi:MAG: hypothetical protein U0556_07885 [Dehalococcoidia bacterium]
MRRFISALVLVALFALAPAVSAVHAEGVSVSPAAGSQHETFTFSGSGFEPGTQLVVAFVAPDGQTVNWYQQGTTDPFIITADDYGDWTFSVLPVEELAGFPAGEWAAAFCVVGGTESCFSGTFTINAE